MTTYGLIGVKVHVYTGEVLGDPLKRRGPRKLIMLQPKQTKFRKMHKGRNRGLAQSGNSIAFG